MTLDAAEVLQATQIASAVTAEMIRNLARGTGGATLPLSATRLGTVGGAADAGTEVLVRPDGDPVAVPAVNAAGLPLNAGDRVLVEWIPPGGVYVTSLLSRGSNGQFVPLWQGPGSVAGNYGATGFYYRIGDLVFVRASMTHGTTSNTGTAMQLGGLPYPIRTTGGLIVHGVGHAYNGTTVFPLEIIGRDGQTNVEIWSPEQLSGTVFITASGSANGGTPFAWGNGCSANLTIVYDTDGA
jgi:hypothetical protein